MKVVVLGASGRLGRHIVEGLLTRGHHVRAFIHTNNVLAKRAHLEILRGDIHDENRVSESVDGVDVVLASLGSWGSPVQDIASCGMTHLVPAMKIRKIRRIVSVTGSAAYDEGEADSPHPYLHQRHEGMLRGAPGLLLDGEKHLAILRRSGLDWTVVRAPVMQDGPRTRYTMTCDPPPPWTTIPYRATATAMIDLAESNAWPQRAPFIR